MTIGGVALSRLLDNPIAYKDGLSRMRTWRAPIAIAVYLGLIGGLGLIAYLIATSTALHQSGAQVGDDVFATMAFTQLALTCVFAPGIAAAAISGERERQTLDILLMTRLTVVEIAIGKLSASLAYVLLLLVAALPVFSVVFLFGGVALDQFVFAELLTFVTAALVACVSLLWSTLFRRTLGATVMSYLTVFALIAGTALVAAVATAFQAVAVNVAQPAVRTINGTVGTLPVNPVVPPRPAVPWEWALNPFYGLYNILFGNPLGAFTGATAPPWEATVILEVAVAAGCFLIAVRALRGRLPRLRMIQP